GGRREGGMLVAGHFLAEFVAEGLPWAHIDVAGPAYNSGDAWGYTPRGGTGVPIRTIFTLVEDIAANG
ncbi:MAG TPA: leucyl aminopeptidase, partial [Mycobacteriales bacterium]